MKRILLVLVIVGFGISSSNAQIRTYTSNAEDSMACLQNLSLYIEFFKQKNYPDAVRGWRKASVMCPKTSESIWVNGVKIYQNLIKAEEDKAKKAALIDTLFQVYDERIIHFPVKEGYVLGRKGADLMKYKKSEPELAFESLMKSLEIQGKKMEPGAIIFLYKSAYDQLKHDKIEKTVLFDLYPRLSDIADYNRKNQKNEKLVEAYKKAQENVDKMFSTVAECPDLVEMYGARIESTPNDEDLLRQILKVFDKRDCTDEAVYQEAAKNLYAIDPSPEAAYAIANGDAKKGNLSAALEYYTKTFTQTEDVELKTKALTAAAKTALASGSFIKAKSLALELLKLNGSNGEAYIIIGDAYAEGGKGCGDNDCTNRAAYWAAVDKYAKAKAVDGSVASQAQQKINAYTAQFPKKEDCFFHGLTEGGSYTLDCWIGETTTIRVRE
ncbi:MAG: hypothetical protein GWP42_13995 [Verrucomicrobiales bacterium]|nr:hypothetical protein [Verrucomicrobiales bacterium]